MKRRGSRAERKVRACLTQNNWLEDGLIRPLNQLTPHPPFSLSPFSRSAYFFTSCPLPGLNCEVSGSALCVCCTRLTVFQRPRRGSAAAWLGCSSALARLYLALRAALYRNCLWPVLIRCYWIRWGGESISALWITGHLYLCV